jgi:hypothetical protein
LSGDKPEDMAECALWNVRVFMKILVEGIKWVGMWSESVCCALDALGHDTDLHYCNVKEGKAYFVSKINKLFPSTRGVLDWEDLQQEKLNNLLSKNKYDVLFSVHGKLDSEQIAHIKGLQPDIKIIYWLGDILDKPSVIRCQ